MVQNLLTLSREEKAENKKGVKEVWNMLEICLKEGEGKSTTYFPILAARNSG